MEINRRNIKEFYENIIDDIENEDERDKLLDDLEEIDDLILLLESHIEEELDKQDDDCLPSQSETWDDFEASRREMMGV